MYNISKELFEAVMGKDTKFTQIDEFYIYFTLGTDITQSKWSILIDSFFFRCKEWALKQRYHLVSCTDKCHIQKKQVSMDMHVKTLQADSEQQAVIDACQWILEEIKD